MARLVDLCNQLRQRRPLGVRNLLQASPECIFEADAGLMSINDDGAFNDRRFHEVYAHPVAAIVPVIRYRPGATKYLRRARGIGSTTMRQNAAFVMADTANLGGAPYFHDH